MMALYFGVILNFTPFWPRFMNFVTTGEKFGINLLGEVMSIFYKAEPFYFVARTLACSR